MPTGFFYNGVEYQYEREYEHPTATAEHRQYFPDFFYPGLNLYHEHFALDAEGQPPPSSSRSTWKGWLGNVRSTSRRERT